MGELNYLRIAQILGGTITEIEEPTFGVFGAARASAERFRLIRQPERIAPLSQHDLERIARAFEKTREGFEVDRVLIDPVLSKRFIAECRRLGVTAPETIINRRLQGLRKSRVYGIKLEDATKAAGINAEKYLYAAELAYVQLGYRKEASVDDLVTDEKIGSEFVSLCKHIAPSGTGMIFKWAALRLRKMRSFPKKKARKLLALPTNQIESRLEVAGTLDRIATESLPDKKGVFSFSELNGTDKHLYVGFAKSVQKAVEPFREAKPFRAVAGPFWRPQLRDITVRYTVAESRKSGESARDLGLRLIEQWEPLFNMPVHIAANGEH